jgi:hypothetical protein
MPAFPDFPIITDESIICHWLQRPYSSPNLKGIYNRIRVSAEDIAKLVTLKNSLLGTNKSVLEESLIAEEKTERLNG